MPIETVRCSKMIYASGMFRGVQCSHTMKIMRNNKPFCNKHDPEKVKAKQAERDAKWQTLYDAQKQVQAAAISLTAELGVGTPEYSMLFGKGHYTGGVILSANEAQRLIARLTKAKR